MEKSLKFSELTFAIIGGAIEVHRHLGPGLLESAYRVCLVEELRLRGLRVEEESPIALTYKSVTVPNAYRLDLVVEDTAIVELKSVDGLLKLHEAQLLTYMKLRRLPVGLLFNFNQASIRKDFRRFIRDV